VDLSGTGKAWILRNGRAVLGTWSHGGQKSPTRYKTKQGDTITLAPGTTFVELMPKTMMPTLGK
jgi:Protein of unknown function (DUF3048) C-terminal domain